MTSIQYQNSLKKRLFDFTLALILLLLFFPLFLLAYPFLKMNLGTPVIFRQKRMGKNKNSFTMFKLKTMRDDAEKLKKSLYKNNEAPFPMFKIKNDPRFIGIGKTLSNLGLDEIPQIVNILKGEMSFIGPRPLPLNEAQKLDDTWNFRYSVRPGILSYWAISPERHQSLEKWKRLEYKTIQINSLVKEIKLIVQTIFQMFLNDTNKKNEKIRSKIYDITIESLAFTVGSYNNVITEILRKITLKKNFILLPCSLNDLYSVSENSQTKKLYQKVDIITTDGMPLVWYSKLKLKKNIERVYGPDLTYDILKKTQGKKYKHCLYGTTKENLEKLELEIKKFAPKINIVLKIAPPFRPLTAAEEKEYIDKIKKNKVNILWIGLNSPKQVELAAKWKEKLPKTSFFCVGAAFDFVAKNKPIAPKFMKENGLEWLFRLVSEPKRLYRRYLIQVPKYLLKKLFT